MPSTTHHILRTHKLGNKELAQLRNRVTEVLPSGSLYLGVDNGLLLSYALDNANVELELRKRGDVVIRAIAAPSDLDALVQALRGLQESWELDSRGYTSTYLYKKA